MNKFIGVVGVGKQNKRMLKIYLEFEEELHRISNILNLDIEGVRKEVLKIAEENPVSLIQACGVYKNEYLKG